jgi:lysozyme
MKISTNGLKLKKYFEFCKLQAYPDPGSKDGRPWTIGWGHTGKEVVKGLVWSQAQADAALVKDADKFSAAVDDLVRIPINQNQFDALVCLAYNIGAAALSSSTLLKMLNSGNYDGAAAQFLRWNKNDGKVMLGLARRRLAEKYLFEGHDVDYCIARAQELI